MNLKRHSLHVGFLGLMLGFSILPQLNAQNCRSESQELPWVVPPALGVISGDGELVEPAKVFIGDRKGTLQVGEVALGSYETTATLTPGNGLPSEVTGIWAISPLNNSIIALVSYVGSGSEVYGFMKSTDQGTTWNLVPTPALAAETHFKVLEGKKTGGVDLTGNLWRVPLYEMTWLGDGLHGWAWGRKGIVRTTDGGNTWSIAYKTNNREDMAISEYEAVWALAFQDKDTGIAWMGPAPAPAAYRTTDGGMTWTQVTPFGQLGVVRPTGFTYISGRYRLTAFNRTQRSSNTYFFSSVNGTKWQAAASHSGSGKILSESVYPTEMLWVGANEGFFVQRQGDVWHVQFSYADKENEGANAPDTFDFNQVQITDESYDTVYYGDGTAVNGNFQPPFFPYAGYGQRTAALYDNFGDPYLVNIITDTCSGDIRPYVALWSVQPFSSVDTDNRTSRSGSSLSLSATPNPVNDQFLVRITLAAPSDATATFINAQGEKVKTVDLGRGLVGRNEIRVATGDLPSGYYRLLVSAGKSHQSISVIVAR